MNPEVCNMTTEQRLKWQLDQERELHQTEVDMLRYQIEVLEAKLARK